MSDTLLEAKLPARVVETTKQALDFDAGFIAGIAPAPMPAPFEHSFEFEAGERVGAAVGLAGDAVAIITGGGLTGGGLALAGPTAGISVAGSEVGVIALAAGVRGAKFHGSQLLDPKRPVPNEARALDELRESGKKQPRERTMPSRKPDPSATVEGKAHAARPLEKAKIKQSIEAEGEAAETLAKEGFRVEWRQASNARTTSDYLIEGKAFDCYTPRTAEAEGAWEEINRKVLKVQTDRVVVNVKFKSFNIASFEKILQQHPIEGLKEVIVVDGKSISFLDLGR